MRFESAQFVASALHLAEFPKRKIPHIVFAGRSNVGKSSLINALFQTKSLAKTSSMPGKTQRINFFLVDDDYFLVDLPGYGYASAPKHEIRVWSSAIDEYLNTCENLKLVLLLIDIRRTPSLEDIALADWATAKNIPLIIVFTKSDKVDEGEKAMTASLSVLPKTARYVLFSNQHRDNRREVIKKINEVLP